MQKRDLIIGVAVLAVIAVIVFFIQNRGENGDLMSPTPFPTASIEETEQNLENKFNVDIPDDLEKADLKDVQGTGFNGIATRNYQNGLFTMTVLADLPDPEDGKFYQVWVSNANGNKALGRLQIAKGGYLLDVSSRQDLTSYNNVTISLESVNDSNMEEAVLQGAF